MVEAYSSKSKNMRYIACIQALPLSVRDRHRHRNIEK